MFTVYTKCKQQVSDQKGRGPYSTDARSLEREKKKSDILIN